MTMLENSEDRIGPYSISGEILVISGVNVSKPSDAERVFCPKKDYEVLFSSIHPDIVDILTIKAVKNSLIVQTGRLLGLPWAVAIESLLHASRYKVIIATGEDVGLPLALLMMIFNVKIPLIITCHNISSRRPAFFLKYLKVAKAVHTFQCLSKSQAMMLTGYPGITREKIHLLYWHVDHQFFAPMPNVQIRNQICSAGMASRDYSTLVKAAEGLDIDVKIAADSPWFQQKLNITKDNLPPWVELRSYKNYQALRQLYAESRFVVIPLLDVPYSAGYTVILEAMSMGKAVIVSRTRQRDDFIKDGWNGIYVTPGNEFELHEKIRFLLERPETTSRLGANARKTVEEHFTLNHYVGRIKRNINCAMGFE